MDPFGAGVTGDCVVFDVGAGHLPQVFCKSCVHTEPRASSPVPLSVLDCGCAAPGPSLTSLQ